MAEKTTVVFLDKRAKKFIGEMQKQVKTIDKRKKSYRSLLSAIVFRDVMKHFEKEHGDDGPWDPWAFSTEERYDKLGKSGNMILADSGHLRQGFIPTNVRSNKEGFLWFNPAKTKTGFPYAFAHNEGGPKLPRRNFMWLSKKARDDMASQTIKFILD